MNCIKQAFFAALLCSTGYSYCLQKSASNFEPGTSYKKSHAQQVRQNDVNAALYWFMNHRCESDGKALSQQESKGTVVMLKEKSQQKTSLRN